MITKITVRKGSAAPATSILASGELGWVDSTSKLYMGTAAGPAKLLNPTIGTVSGVWVLGGEFTVETLPAPASNQEGITYRLTNSGAAVNDGNKKYDLGDIVLALAISGVMQYRVVGFEMLDGGDWV